MEDDLLPFQARLSALAQLQQNKIHRGIRPMAHKAQPLGFQIDLRTPDDQLGQPFRTVDEEKVAAVFQRPSGGPEQVGGGAGVLPTGKGGGAAGGAAGKIGGIGDADIKASRRKTAGNLPHIDAYTFHAGRQAVAADVVDGGEVGTLRQLHAGDAAAFIHGAQQQPQCAAAGAEIQHPGVFGEPDKMGQHHGIGAQGKSAFRQVQGKSVG